MFLLYVNNIQNLFVSVIHMLQKLQQALVAQQQQQQQRQLQDLLRQLLSMQKPGSNNFVTGTSLSVSQDLLARKNNSNEDSCETGLYSVINSCAFRALVIIIKISVVRKMHESKFADIVSRNL